MGCLMLFETGEVRGLVGSLDVEEPTVRRVGDEEDSGTASGEGRMRHSGLARTRRRFLRCRSGQRRESPGAGGRCENHQPGYGNHGSQ